MWYAFISKLLLCLYNINDSDVYRQIIKKQISVGQEADKKKKLWN